MPEIWDCYVPLGANPLSVNSDTVSIPWYLSGAVDASYSALRRRLGWLFVGHVGIVCSTRRGETRKWWSIRFYFGDDIPDRVHIQRRPSSWVKKVSCEGIVKWTLFVP